MQKWLRGSFVFSGVKCMKRVRLYKHKTNEIQTHFDTLEAGKGEKLIILSMFPFYGRKKYFRKHVKNKV